MVALNLPTTREIWPQKQITNIQLQIILHNLFLLPGVEITDTVLDIQNGYLQEGVSSSTILFDVSLLSNPDGGSVSGSNLWDITAWISTDPVGVSTRYLEQSILLTSVQSGTPIVSGVNTAIINGVSAEWDLAVGPLCTQASYMCVRVQKGNLANPDFQVTGTPNDEVFTACAQLQCRGKSIRGINTCHAFPKGNWFIQCNALGFMRRFPYDVHSILLFSNPFRLLSFLPSPHFHESMGPLYLSFTSMTKVSVCSFIYLFRGAF